MNVPSHTLYMGGRAGRNLRALLWASLVAGLLLLTGIAPVALRVPATVVLLTAAVASCYRLGRWLAGCRNHRAQNTLHLIASIVVVTAVLAIAPALYRPLLLAPVVTVLLVDAGVVAAARLELPVGLSRGTGAGIGVVVAVVIAVIAVPRLAASTGGLTYPTPPSASLAFAGSAADQAAPLPAGATMRVSVLYTPLSASAPLPQARFGGRPIAPVSTRWSHRSLLLTYRVDAARAACLTPFVVTAPPGSPGPDFPADRSRARLRISLWVGARRAVTVCRAAGSRV